MFSKEVQKENMAMEKRWRNICSQMLNGGKIMSSNESGIELKPVYTPEDINDMDYKEIALPGEYPLTRGNYPLHYQVMPLIMAHGYGFGTAEETRRRREWLTKLGSTLHVGKEGFTTYVLAIDLPTQRGFDPDEPEARGRVGDCGLSISTMEDLKILYDGLPIDKIFTTFIALDNTLPVNAVYAAYVLDERKLSLDKLYLVTCNFHHHQWAWDCAAFPPATAMKLNTEFIKFIVENCPLSFPLHVEGYNVGEAGATPVQEAAFNLAYTVCLMEECLKVGLDPDDVASKCFAHPHIGMNLFEEIAKIRATRRWWAKTFKERFGCKRPESLHYRPLVAQTSGIALTAQEALNNIIRTTIMTMAGMLSGLDGIWTSSYDEALGIPTEEAVQLAVRVQQILSEETDITKVTDPLGGSYYIEWLTNRMEEEINKVLKRMEELGGFMKCWETGWIRGEVEKAAYDRFKRLENGEDVKVGMNKYRVEETPQVEAFRVSPEIEAAAVAKVKKYRQARDNAKTRAALEKVREAALRIEKEWPRSCGCLMPALIEAARAGATTGEMHRVMREVFGFGYYSG